MEFDVGPCQVFRRFAIICVLGAPGAGKGTICTQLAQRHNLVHYSVGDSLRDLIRQDRTTPLAARIQDKLDNQGFLSPDDLNPLIGQAINNAICQENARTTGILIDGFPRCNEQLQSFDIWPFKHCPLLAPNNTDRSSTVARPDIVLLLNVSSKNARARYLQRGRDDNDSADKFERRLREYQVETVPVIDVYRRRGILIEIDANDTKEETNSRVVEALASSRLWQDTVVGRST